MKAMVISLDVAYQQMKTFLDVFLDSVNDAITGVDREGTVLYWNKVAERMYGIPNQEIVGKRIGEFFQKGSIMLFQVMESGSPVRQVYHQPRPDKHVLINAVPIYDEQNRLIGAISIEQDITHTIKLNEELFSKPSIIEQMPSDFSLMKVNNTVENIIQFASRTFDLLYPILLSGELGVGKETVALMINHATRRSGPFLSISCDTIPSGLLDTELFGYQGGVFGDHAQERIGKLELARGGIIYLRNIHRLPLSTQEKLAQVLNNKQYYRVGGKEPLPLECLVIASSIPEIESLITKGSFLQKLYYAFHSYLIPPLRERKEELPELFHQMLAEISQALGKPMPSLTTEAMAALTLYQWPGNLTQLRNVMERLITFSIGQDILLNELPDDLQMTTLTNLTKESLPLSVFSEEMERSKIEEALKRSGGNKAGACRLLGISRGSLYYKMKQYGLPV
jgi:sigma-54 dependent transcriptional regulator, acetoin dehydrogenase operon transcriptional activator AcoR